MKIHNSVALVTGANRGLGLAYARALLAAGARKVYAAARDPDSVTEPGLIPLRLDVTDPQQIAAAARSAGDVSLLINNAGIIQGQPLLAEGAADTLRRQFETNTLGVLEVARAFAPVLAANGGGALVNMLSVLSWVSLPGTAGYSASKAAAWAVTNGLRQELAAQNTLVIGVHAGYIDTDMVRSVEAPKARPEDIAAQVMQAIEQGRFEVLADEISRSVKAGLSSEKAPYLGG